MTARHDAETQQRARLAVCTAAGGDVDAAREVLEALGLIAPPTAAQLAARQKERALEHERAWMLNNGYMRPVTA